MEAIEPVKKGAGNFPAPFFTGYSFIDSSYTSPGIRSKPVPRMAVSSAPSQSLSTLA